MNNSIIYGGLMKYLMDLSNTQNDRIQKLIQEGKYQSIASFIYSAIENQLHLEESPPGIITNEEQLKNTQLKSEFKWFIPPDIKMSVTNQLLSMDISDTLTVEPPANNRITIQSAGKESEANLWIWGQVNKIFPLKVGLRVLGNMLKQNKVSEIDLSLYREAAAKTARDIGLKLLSLENSKKTKRGERVSSGLPIGEQAFSSESRYKTHFLATIRKDGILDGALAKYKFVNIESRDKTYFIGVTKWGLEFARLENPILDKQDYTISLSDEEIDYCLKHIVTNVPGEQMAIKWMANAIKNG